MVEILALVVVGVITGWIAQLILLSEENVHPWVTLGLGIAGSFMGAAIYHIFVKDIEGFDGTSLSAGIVGAVLSLSFHRAIYKLFKQ